MAESPAIRRLRGVAIAMLIVLAASAFALGAGPLVDAGQDAGMALPFLVPVLVDAGLVLTGTGALALAARRQRAWPLRVGSGLLLGVSFAVQVEHAIARTASVTAIVLAGLPAVVLWLAAWGVENLTVGREVSTAAAAPQPSTRRAPRKPDATRESIQKGMRTASSAGLPTSLTVSMSLDEAVAAVRAGELSQRQAAAAAGVSRYAIESRVA